MRLARYIGNGQIAICDEPAPNCPQGGLLVRTEACGLCSGELMDWYMEQKVPHVLGHEVAGIVAESQDVRFPTGCRVFPHHHAPCLRCAQCLKGLYVHCERWKRTKLDPGGMAEYVAVAAENLTDTLRVDDLAANDAAMIEPLACVVKSLHQGGISPCSAKLDRNTAVIGLGVMGLMHMLLVPDAVGYDLNPARVGYARSLGLTVKGAGQHEKADVIFVCPGNKSALDLAIDLASPGGTIVLFAPMPPGEETPVDLNRLYFKEIKVANSYSCGPDETRAAVEILRSRDSNFQVPNSKLLVSDFIAIDQLPEAYQKMKRGEILKPMVVF